LDSFEASLFPFLDLPQRDPVTGKTDGLLTKLPEAARPKIFYTNSSGEYWGGGRAAALTHTTLDGRQDAMLPDNVRIYLFAGTQHVPGGYLASQGEGQQQPNPNDYAWGHRALLVAMERWVRSGIMPPPSRHPLLADHTLVTRDDIDFPAIPGVRSPRAIPGGYRADLAGPPAFHPLPMLVPQVDGDGNELAGIQQPDVAVPLATYTGWISAAEDRPADRAAPAHRLLHPVPGDAGGTRGGCRSAFSIEERYGDRARYQALVSDRAGNLVRDDTCWARTSPRWSSAPWRAGTTSPGERRLRRDEGRWSIGLIPDVVRIGASGRRSRRPDRRRTDTGRQSRTGSRRRRR